MKHLTIYLNIIIFFFCSCSNDNPIDNSKPFQSDYTVCFYFVDKNGNDATAQIPMKQINPTEDGHLFYCPPNEFTHYELVPNDYIYKCFLNKEEIDKQYLNGSEYTPTVWLEITDNPKDQRKLFVFVLYTTWNQINYTDAYSGRTYEFEYRFSIPALFGEKENVLKIRSEACKFWDGDYESATFNGKPITPSGNRTFEIIVD